MVTSLLKLKITLYHFRFPIFYYLVFVPLVYFGRKKVDLLSAIILLASIPFIIVPLIKKKKKYLLAMSTGTTQITVTYLDNLMRAEQTILDTSDLAVTGVEDKGVMNGRFSLLIFKTDQVTETFEVIDKALLTQSIKDLNEFYLADS